MGWVGKNPHGFCWNTTDLKPGSSILLGLESLAGVQDTGRSTTGIPFAKQLGNVLRAGTSQLGTLSSSITTHELCDKLLSFHQPPFLHQ